MAASVALFVGLASFWRVGHQPGGAPFSGNGSISAGAPDAIERCQTLENLYACFSGPGVRARLDCGCVDADADGDVDLRDVGSFRLEESGR